MYLNSYDSKTPQNAPGPRDPADTTRQENCPCPAACIDCPDDCPACNPPEPRHMCARCGWAGARENFMDHDCNNPDPEPDPDAEASYEIPTQRVSQLTVDLIDRIDLHPLDPHHVIRIADGTQVPVSPVGVMRILGQDLDQRTAAAVAAELAYRTRAYVRSTNAGNVLAKACAQHALRRYIQAQLAVVK